MEHKSREQVYSAVVIYAFNHGGNHPTLAALSRITGLSITNVNFHLHNLIENGRLIRNEDKALETVGGYLSAYRSIIVEYIGLVETVLDRRLKSGEIDGISGHIAAGSSPKKYADLLSALSFFVGGVWE